MPSIRFVKGTEAKFSTVYESDLPVVPRTGEFLSIRAASGEAIAWEVTRVCHVMSEDLRLVRTIAWIEQPDDRDRALADDWMTSYDRADNDDPADGTPSEARYSTPTD